MPFIDEILKHRSLSIVGLEKNTGKTVCMNYILHRLNQLGVLTAVTSIGVDGEQTDAVYGTAKPDITLFDNNIFITSEKHYRQRSLVSNILSVDTQSTSLGRLITAQVVVGGKVLLSGAASTAILRRQIATLSADNVPLTIVDGALARLSLASPTVTDAMVLATGAAVSPNINQLISKTRFVCKLIALPEVDSTLKEKLSILESGLWALDDNNNIHNLNLASAFMISADTDLYRFGNTFFAAGAVSDRLLKHLATHKQIAETRLIVRDFTKLFLTPETYNHYRSRGGQLFVLQQSKLLAVCLNPTSPQGFTLHSKEACLALSDALQLPVYDVMKTQQ